MAYLGTSRVKAEDSPSVDAFSRWRVSDPTGVFDGQFTYNLLPLIYEQVTAESGAAVAHDATNRCATMTFASTPTGGKAFMQSYEHIRYQPGKSQAIFVTFNFIEAVANCLKFAGYSSGATNGIELQQDGTTVQFKLYSDTTNGDQTVAQANWNLDPLNGTGTSGLTLDLTKTQILVIDLQALYVGRVRVGFDISGLVVYAHEFNHANLVETPYIQTATQPIRCGMTCTGTVSTTMRFICAAVSSEGGSEDASGYSFSAGSASVNSGNSARAHIISLRPTTTFNSITNRIKFVLDSVDILVTGNTAVLWELVIGQAITGASYSAVNATYSGFESSAGTISGDPGAVIAAGYIPATAQNKGSFSYKLANRYPITLDAAGAVRANGTLSILGTGLGAASAMYARFNWHELR